MVQLSHLYITIRKAKALTVWTSVGKGMSPIFYMLFRFVIAFFPWNKPLLISWLQSPSAVILEPEKIKHVTVSTFSPLICHKVMGPDAMILVFWMLSFKAAFSLSSFTLIKKLFSSSLLSAIRVVSFAYLRLLIFLLAILIPTCASFRPAFHMMYSVYKSNYQGNNIQPCCTPFPNLNQSVTPGLVLTVASWSAYRFLRRQVRWSGIPIFLRISHSLLWSTVKGFNIVNAKEVDFIFLEFPLFFYDPLNVGNLISGSSAFSKSSLYIWNFLVHILLKPNLKDFEHYLASMGNERNCTVIWIVFGIALLWDWKKNWTFPVLWPLLSFPNLLVYWVQHFNSIIF